MKRPGVVVVILLLTLGGVLFSVSRDGERNAGLLVFCAAGLRGPMAEIARNYEAETGVPVRLQLGGSGALEAQLEVAGGDLFLPADGSYLESVRKKGLLGNSFPVARMRAGIVVVKGNPKEIMTLADLAKPGTRLSMADGSAAIGKHVRELLAETGELEAVTRNITVTKPTVNNTVEDVATGAVDATIGWDAVARGFSEVEWIEVPAFSERPVDTGIGVLLSSKQPEAAEDFARYVAAEDKGRRVFVKYGFSFGEGAGHE